MSVMLLHRKKLGPYNIRLVPTNPNSFFNTEFFSSLRHYCSYKVFEILNWNGLNVIDLTENLIDLILLVYKISFNIKCGYNFQIFKTSFRCVIADYYQNSSA